MSWYWAGGSYTYRLGGVQVARRDLPAGGRTSRKMIRSISKLVSVSEPYETTYSTRIGLPLSYDKGGRHGFDSCIHRKAN